MIDRRIGHVNRYKHRSVLRLRPLPLARLNCSDYIRASREYLIIFFVCPLHDARRLAVETYVNSTIRYRLTQVYYSYSIDYPHP
jgi:hypothetical protein